MGDVRTDLPLKMDRGAPKSSEVSPEDVTCRIQGSRIVDPSAELEHMYVLEEDEEKMRKYDHEKLKGGKWILFFKTTSLHSMWRKSCLLYRYGKLEGIKSLKASTGKKNPRSSSNTVGVVIFHCGPSDNKHLMLTYGMNLVQQLRYVSSVGFIPYKSDEQSAVGTRGTGVRTNYLYRLPVPTKWHQHTPPVEKYSWRSSAAGSHDENWRSTKDREDFKSYKTEQNSMDASTNVPSAVLDVPWLCEPQDFGVVNSDKPDDEPGNWGFWLMFVSKKKIDDTWMKAVKLFREGDFPDEVQCVKVSTELQNYKSATGVVKFLVERTEDIDYLKGIGSTLAKLMNYSSTSGHMLYRCLGTTICSVEVAEPDLP